MQRVALSVELGVGDPAEIHAVARGPDDGAHPGYLDVELVYGGEGSGFGHRAGIFRRSDEPVALDVGIDSPLEELDERLTSGERGRQVVGEAQPRTVGFG